MPFMSIVKWIWCRTHSGRLVNSRCILPNAVPFIPTFPLRKFQVIGQHADGVTVLIEDKRLDSWIITPERCQIYQIDSHWKGRQGWNVMEGSYLPVKEGGCEICRKKFEKGRKIS